MLVDVIVLEALQGLDRLMQTRCGHAPSADRSAYQINGLMTLRQPIAEQKTVQRPQDQALRPARCARNHAHMARHQAVFADMGQGFGASVDAKRLHDVLLKL
jgi:choline dehydrogenase-like flavoprotein